MMESTCLPSLAFFLFLRKSLSRSEGLFGLRILSLSLLAPLICVHSLNGKRRSQLLLLQPASSSVLQGKES